jgi:hypothetical protein
MKFNLNSLFFIFFLFLFYFCSGALSTTVCRSRLVDSTAHCPCCPSLLTYSMICHHCRRRRVRRERRIKRRNRKRNTNRISLVVQQNGNITIVVISAMMRISTYMLTVTAPTTTEFCVCLVVVRVFIGHY